MSVFSVSHLTTAPSPAPLGELLALEDPVVGESMSLYRSLSGRRVCTTKVERVLALTSGELFVQTRNTTYRLESLGGMPFALTRTGNDW